MNENRTHRSIAALLLAVTFGVLAPAVSRADVGVATALGSSAARGVYRFGVIDEGPTPITGIASRIAYYFGVIEDGPSGVRHRRGVIDQGPEPVPLTQRRAVTIRSGVTSR